MMQKLSDLLANYIFKPSSKINDIDFNTLDDYSHAQAFYLYVANSANQIRSSGAELTSVDTQIVEETAVIKAKIIAPDTKILHNTMKTISIEAARFGAKAILNEEEKLDQNHNIESSISFVFID